MSKTIDVETGAADGWPPKRNKGFKRFGEGGGGKPPLIVTIAAATFGVILIVGLLMGASGKLGIANIAPKEVGVVVNYLTGEQEVITQPGFKIYVPFIQEVYTFDRTTQEFSMEGNKSRSANHVPRLTVRAKDGSNFWFDRLDIQYELLSGDAGIGLNDSGDGDNFKQEWIKAYARSILRDEFGRFSAVEAANPTLYARAPSDAAARMNELLHPHGINVVRIVTPNPKFDPDYETAIETRKEANQEVEELIARAEQLKQVREQRLAAVRKEKDVEMQQLRGELVRQLREAEVSAIEINKSADAYAARRVAEGQALKARLTAEAQGLTAKYTKEAEGVASRAQALEQRGEVVVREALIQKLMQIRFTLVPYSRDPVPKRLEHIDARGRDASSIDPESLGR